MKIDLEQALESRETCQAAGLKYTALLIGGFPYEMNAGLEVTP
jgi:hypothetical protein